jgi:hypothetical protein
MSKTKIIGAITVAVAAAFIWMGFGIWRTDVPSSSSNSAGTEVLHATLDPELFTGNVHDAYAAARTHPDILAQLHCYCGCDRELGHRNLLDCFRDRHATQCEICMGEALLAARMADQGMPVDDIIGAIRARYARGG